MAISIIKKTFLLAPLLLFAFSFVGEAEAATLGRPPNNLGLIGYWSFDEGTSTTAGDFSGKGNTGTLTSMATPPLAPSGWTAAGKHGAAIQFDGSNDYVNLGTGLRPSLPVTVSAWIKLDAITGQEQGIFSTDKTQASAHNHAGVWFNVTATGGLVANFGDNTSCSTASRRTVTSTNVFNTGQWYFVAATLVNQTTMNIYVNGVDTGAAVSGNGGAAIVYSSNAGSIGKITACNNGADLGFDGTIDDVRFYSRALSASEIATLYKSGGAKLNSQRVSTITNGLVGRWTFDGADITTTVVDRSGNGNNGYYISSVANTATSSAKTIGKIGQALAFISTDNTAVSLGTPSSLNLQGSLTISAWIKPTRLSNVNPRIFDKQASGQGYQIALNQSSPNNSLQFNTNLGVSVNANSDIITLNKWQFVTVVYDSLSNTATFYVDAVQSGSGSPGSGSPTDSSATAAYIGRRSTDTSRNFDGFIDDVRVYSRALTAAEVKTIYNEGNSNIVNASSATLGNNGTLNQGLVGLWTFDGGDITTTVVDKTGQGNNGYIFNTATTTAKVIGRLGQALNFTGGSTATHVRITNPSALHFTSAVTVSAWIKTPEPSSDRKILGDQDQANRGYKLGLNGSKVEFEIRSVGSGTTLNRAVGGGTTLAANTWYHVVGLFSNNDDYLATYVNGALDRELSTASTLDAGTADFYIGGVPLVSDASSFFPGSIDDVRVYNRRLTTNEIKQLYLMGK